MVVDDAVKAEPGVKAEAPAAPQQAAAAPPAAADDAVKAELGVKTEPATDGGVKAEPATADADAAAASAAHAAAVKRAPKRRYAIIFGYSGTGYQGMQMNPGARTIEDELFKAICKTGHIFEQNFGDLHKARTTIAFYFAYFMYTNQRFQCRPADARAVKTRDVSGADTVKTAIVLSGTSTPIQKG